MKIKWNGHENFTIAGVEDFLNIMGGTTKTGKSEIDIKADDLPSPGTAVWVLEHTC